MRRVVIAIALLLLFGAARLPLEIHLAKLQQQAGFHTAKLDLPLRQQLGQSSFVAALSGFRSLVAVILWIQANDSWQKVEWGRMAGQLQNVTTLQPKSTLYWDMSAWHMAWNAAIAAMEDKSQPSEALRRLKQRQYFDIGKKFYEDGLLNNPDSAYLWERYGDLLSQKYEDHAAAFKAYKTAASKPGARPQMKREAAYELAKIPGRERDAYNEMKAIYDLGDKERLPSVIASLKRLEEKLGIPADQRIKESNAH